MRLCSSFGIAATVAAAPTLYAGGDSAAEGEVAGSSLDLLAAESMRCVQNC